MTTQNVTVKIMRAAAADPEIALPSYASAGAAGADLRANLADRGSITLAPGEIALVPTGCHFMIPEGYEVQIRARSGRALRDGLGLANGIGTIDCDYRGEVGVIMVNFGRDSLTIAHGERIAQMVVAPVIRADFELVEALPSTERGAGGFGSTGRG